MTEWHTKYFRNADEVEAALGITLFGETEMMVLEYLRYGIVPDSGGCWTCGPGAARKTIASIRDYESAVDRGEIKWPWSHTQSPSSESIQVQLPGLPGTQLETKALS